jgi:hypothetical protein
MLKHYYVVPASLPRVWLPCVIFFGMCTESLLCMQDVLTAALESGISTFLFPRELLDLADSWGRLGRMACVFSNGDTLLDSRMEVISHCTLPLGNICTKYM